MRPILIDAAQVMGMEDRKWKVLIIDNDQTYLMILDKMLQICNVMATQCGKAKEALSMLQEDPNRFDIVIMDLHIQDLDGFELLRHVTEMDRPVIVTSWNDDEDLMRKVILGGASDYLVKPIRAEQIRHLWKYIYQAERHGINKRPMDQFGSNSEEESNPSKDDLVINDNNPVGANASGSSDEEGSKCITRKSNGDDQEENNQESKNNSKEGDAQTNDDASATTNTTFTTTTINARKKQRVIWTPELHDKFVAAVNQFGTLKAVPKKILEIMNVPGLTRENVASHLQKYRQFRKKMEQSLQQRSTNLVNLMPSQEQQRFQRISPITNLPDEVVTKASFPSVQASDTAKPMYIVEDIKQEMKLHTSLSDENDAYVDRKGDVEMSMAIGEAGNEVNMINNHDNYVASCTYSTVDSRFHMVEIPCPNWASGLLYDENSLQNEMEITSMAPVGQPYGYGDINHASRGADCYGNMVDLSYNDPYATLYVEHFEQNDHYIIGQLQQQNFGHALGFGGDVDEWQ